MSGKGGYFQKLSLGSETSDMTSQGLGEMFEGDSADTCAETFPLVSMGGQEDVLACTWTQDIRKTKFDLLGFF